MCVWHHRVVVLPDTNGRRWLSVGDVELVSLLKFSSSFYYLFVPSSQLEVREGCSLASSSLLCTWEVEEWRWELSWRRSEDWLWLFFLFFSSSRGGLLLLTLGWHSLRQSYCESHTLVSFATQVTTETTVLLSRLQSLSFSRCQVLLSHDSSVILLTASHFWCKNESITLCLICYFDLISLLYAVIFFYCCKRERISLILFT